MTVNPLIADLFLHDLLDITALCLCRRNSLPFSQHRSVAHVLHRRTAHNFFFLSIFSSRPVYFSLTLTHTFPCLRLYCPPNLYSPFNTALRRMAAGAAISSHRCALVLPESRASRTPFVTSVLIAAQRLSAGRSRLSR